uniref:Uncharacterized protein n=1 Tax=Setaria italica TaxID=4555 RepID=K4AMK0_SETIT
MEGGSDGSSRIKKQQAADAACGGKLARPHWRRRDPADTVVLVQLTSANSLPQAAAGTSANAAAQQQQNGDGGGGSGRTLGQMQQECMAWANSEDDQ